MNNYDNCRESYDENDGRVRKNRRVGKTIVGVIVGIIIGIVGTVIAIAGLFLLNDSGVYSKLVAVKAVLDSYYLYDYDETKLADMAAAAAVMSVEDPYSVYYSKEEFSDLLDSSNGDFVGIGATVSVTENNEIIILEPMNGSPAKKAGLEPGDILLKIDGVEYTGEQLEDAIRVMRGIDSGRAEGVEFKVTIKRGEEIFDVKLTRERIHTDSVSHKMLSDRVGYIKIDAFNTKTGSEKDTYEEFYEAVADLKKSGADKLIFDVRDNGGGDAEVVSKILDYLLPEGLIMYTEDKYGEREEIKSDASELDMEMAVITNERSASAAELFTGALKDYKKAIIVGKKTFGKGVVQSVIPFMDGSGIKVTTSSYFTPGGTCVQGVGITPDIEVDLPEEYKNTSVTNLEFEQDIQLKKAVEALIKSE